MVKLEECAREVVAGQPTSPDGIMQTIRREYTFPSRKIRFLVAMPSHAEKSSKDTDAPPKRPGKCAAHMCRTTGQTDMCSIESAPCGHLKGQPPCCWNLRLVHQPFQSVRMYAA